MNALPDETLSRFRDGVRLAADNRIVEALAAFRDVVDRWPDHALADDALYDMGACYLALGRSSTAEATFQRLLERHPDARIATEERSGVESGPTAAKAWLGLVAARLGRGDVRGAQEACERLRNYPDAVVHPAPGIERTFAEIGWSLLAAFATGTGTDVVTPADVANDG